MTLALADVGRIIKLDACERRVQAISRPRSTRLLNDQSRTTLKGRQ